MGLRRVGPPQQEDLRAQDFVEGTGSRSGAEGGRETRDRRGVSDPSGIVYIVGPQDRPGKLLDHIYIFVRDAR